MGDGGLRNLLFERLRENWKMCEDASCIEDSIIYKYMLGEYEKEPRVLVKSSFVKEDQDAEGKDPLRVCLELIRDSGAPQEYYDALGKLPKLEISDTEWKAGLSKKDAQTAIQLLLNDDEARVRASAESVRGLAVAILSHNSHEKMKPCARALECKYDMLMMSGEGVLQEGWLNAALEQLRNDMEGRTRGRYALDWPEGDPDIEFMDKLIRSLLVKVINDWFYNRSKNASPPKGIPIDLVNAYLDSNRQLAQAVGLDESGRHPLGTRGLQPLDMAVRNNSTKEWANDVCDLYKQILFNEDSTGEELVPLMINPATGLGLFLFGKRYAAEFARSVGAKTAFGQWPFEPDRPFIALAYHEWVNHKLGVLPYESKNGMQGVTVENLWGEFMRAWMPQGDVSKKAFDTELMAKVMEAYVGFTEVSTELDSLVAYQEVNIYMPEKCPLRFQRFFNSEDKV